MSTLHNGALKVTVPEQALVITPDTKAALDVIMNHAPDASYWLYGLAIEYARTGDIQKLDALICDGLDFRFNDGLLLYAAVHANQLTTTRYLVEKGIDVNTAKWHANSLLECAAENGLLEMCELLLALGADLFAPNHTPVHSAAMNGHTAICRLFYAHGATSNFNNTLNHNPLLAAARNGHTETLAFLLVKDGYQAYHARVLRLLKDEISADTLLVFMRHGIPDNTVSDFHFSRIVTAPSKLIKRLTPELPEAFLMRCVKFHAKTSQQGIMRLMEKAPDFLRPYYLEAMGKDLQSSGSTSTTTKFTLVR